MPKIKNWSKKDVETIGVEHQWINDKTGSKLRVVLHGTYVHGGINRPDKPYALKLNKELITDWKYKSQEDARKAAVKWMRKHPNA